MAPLAMTVATAAFAAPGAGAAQGGGGISLESAPSPPSAVKIGTGAQRLGWTATYRSAPDRVVTSIVAPGETAPFQVGTVPIAGLPSPQAGTFSFSPPAGSSPGRYTGRVEYFATSGVAEASASVVFDVAADLGTLVLIGFEDLDGNGVRDAGEPGLPGWRFALTNPDGNPSEVLTRADGSVTLTDAPAGTWNVRPLVSSGWVVPGAAGGAGPAAVPGSGVAAFAVAAVRPAAIAGRVFRDDDRDGVADPGEPGLGGVALSLSRTQGVAAAAPPLPTTSDGGGGYAFTGNAPGLFRVSATPPPGWVATSPDAEAAVASGADTTGWDLGFAPPVPPTAAVAGAPDVRLGKGGPLVSRRGRSFAYTIVVRNRGAAPARRVRVIDRLPRQLRFRRAPRGASVRRSVATWRLGDLAPGERRVLRVPVRVVSTSAGTVVRNTATLTAAGQRRRRASAVTRLTPGATNARRLRPRVGRSVATRRPTLRWARRAGARLYNVQVFAFRGRQGRPVKILSAFPSRPSFRLPAGRLRFGERYSWRVWPFYGRGRGFARRPIGVSHFRVLRPSRARSRGRASASSRQESASATAPTLGVSRAPTD